MIIRKIVVISNEQDARSRAWADLYVDDTQHDRLDWYGDPDRVEQYRAEGHPDPSAFPSVVDTTTDQIVRMPETMDDAIALLNGQLTLKERVAAIEAALALQTQ